MKIGRSGCAGLFSLFFILCLAFLVIEWPFYIDQNGIAATAQVSEKHESVRIYSINWYRRFQIVAAYRVPGIPMDRHAACDVEQEVYDSLHIGAPVTVHYLSFLGNTSQPFIPGAHLAPCTLKANFGSNRPLFRKLAAVFGALAAILFAAFALRLRIALWLMVPWVLVFVYSTALPQLEPAPQEPRPALAKVRYVTTVTSILQNTTGSGSHSFRGIQLSHPFQIIELEFVPEGRTDPVVAVDSINQDSLPALRQDQTVPIDYDSSNPRIARIRGGVRDFASQAVSQVLAQAALLAGVMLLLLFAARRIANRRRSRRA